MASEIKVDTIVNAGGDNDTGIDLATNDQILLKVANATKLTMNSTGQTTIVGEGGTTTTSVQQGLAKNWSQVKGTDTFTLNDSFNVSSATDQGTGVARINLTSNFNNTNYSASATHNSGGWGYNGTIDDVTTARYDIHSQQTNTTGSADSPRANSATHGDLA